MKTYEVRLGSSEGESTAPFNGKSFRKLSDASAQMKRIVAMLQDDNSLISDDLGIWIIRKTPAKMSRERKRNWFRCSADWMKIPTNSATKAFII
ncbi:hypothetical protein [Allobaculum sp. Allo2]|uniref:hypothetical protein n=1 Tax=Allobaculum sp. Allo2 TaxID=2853432 RepID=UPI001F61CF6F|nr:hypothetical protein [Allobaculum sp. Allo2]UNT92703.1 hypothetical protein KWG61_11375 [Allobaculum sp. Allo2]